MDLLRRRKLSRQVVITTQNANIPVNGGVVPRPGPGPSTEFWVVTVHNKVQKNLGTVNTAGVVTVGGSQSLDPLLNVMAHGVRASVAQNANGKGIVLWTHQGYVRAVALN